MSRIGKMPIPVPAGVEVKIDGSHVTVKGPKGTLSRTLSEDMNLAMESGTITVTRPSDAKKHRSLHGLTRTLINNMVVGVTSGYEKSLDLVGIGYRANKQGAKLVLSVGYSHPVEVVPEDGLEIDVPAPNKVIIRGIDKEKVGQLAADIRKIRKPEPYKGKGIRYTDETIRLKAGKAGKKS